MPAPRSVVGVVPSSSCRRARREGSKTRALNSGRTDRVSGALSETWRAPRCSGPQERMVTTSAWRVPRRVGARIVMIFSDECAPMRTRRRGGAGCKDGGHASRTSRVIGRFVVLDRRSVASVVWSARIGPVTSRVRRRVRGEGAPSASRMHAATTRPNHVHANAREGANARGMSPARTRSALRAETITGRLSGGPGSRREHPRSR